MKARGRLVFLACAAALLALPAVASGATGKAGELRLSVIELQGSDGYEVEAGAMRGGGLGSVAVVDVRRGPVGVNYAVRPDPGAGIHATFGSLGQLDVSFERRKRKVEEAAPGCRTVFERGVFRGSFRFLGEGGYFSSEAVDPVGEVMRLPNGFCGFDDDRRARLAIPGLEQTVLAVRGETDSGSAVSFQASRLRQAPAVSFSASLRERVEGMKIERTAQAAGEKQTFLSSKAARASVSPPPPFDGGARFRDPAGRPATWTGSLSVSFPGAPDVALVDEAFTVKLCPRVPLLTRCLPGSGSSAFYGSGSHSQPLALARLSSLR